MSQIWRKSNSPHRYCYGRAAEILGHVSPVASEQAGVADTFTESSLNSPVFVRLLWQWGISLKQLGMS